MSEEHLEKTFDGYLPGTKFRMVTWTKTVRLDATEQAEMDKRFNYSCTNLEGKKAYVGGAGTIASPVMTDLVLAGFKDITIVDFDTIEYANLARSQHYSASDVGKYKALVMAREAAKQSPFGVTVTGIVADISALGYGFIKDKDVILSVFDSWSARAFNSAAASFYGKTHITCGTADINGVMYSTITLEPAGCNACYSCHVPGSFKKEEKRLSCLNYKDETQPQVMAFSSTGAGFASQLAISAALGTLNVPVGKDGRPLSCKYVFRELGKFDDRNGSVMTTSVMSRTDDRSCVHHGAWNSLEDKNIHDIRVKRNCTSDELIQRLNEVFGHGDEFEFDLRRSMLLSIVFPLKNSGNEPVSSMTLFEGCQMDPGLMKRLPTEHIYYVTESDVVDGETKLIRMVLED